MSLLKVTGAILAVLAGIVVLCLGVIWVEKRFPGGEMDERQRQAQGRASGFAMVLGMLYFFAVVLLLLRQVDGPKTVEPWLLVFIGILLMVTADHTYCLLCYASLPLSQSPVLSIVGYGLTGAIQLLYVWHATAKMPLSWTGHGTSGWIHLLTGISFLYLSLIHLIQYLRDRREGHE